MSYETRNRFEVASCCGAFGASEYKRLECGQEEVAVEKVPGTHIMQMSFLK